jgi:hypothetical protein
MGLGHLNAYTPHIMTAPLIKCVVCGENFVLEQNKAGFANRCPACSPARRRTPKEAREAIGANAETAFRETILEKRKAEANGDWALADKLELDIQAFDKQRLKPKRTN